MKIQIFRDVTLRRLFLDLRLIPVGSEVLKAMSMSLVSAGMWRRVVWLGLFFLSQGANTCCSTTFGAF
jgi:hypothetical protein